MLKRNSFVILCSAVFAMSLALTACNKKSGSSQLSSTEESEGSSSSQEQAEKQWTVTFDSQGGSAVSAVKVDNGHKLVKPKDPSRADYNFDGWFEEKAALTPFNFDISITADWTLYAGWTEKRPEPQPDPDPDPQPIAVAEYYFKLNEQYYGLTENEQFIPQPGSTATKEYYAHVGAVSGGETFSFANSEKAKITNIGSDPEDSSNKNNYDGTMVEGESKIHNAASTMDVYMKVYPDGYSFWLTGYDNSELVESPYYVMIGSSRVDLEAIGTDSTDPDNIVAKYSGSIESVTAGAAIEFHNEGEIIRPGSDPEDAEHKNNINGSWDDGFTIHNDATDVDIYLKLYDDQGYSFWITGYLGGGDPVPENKYYVQFGDAEKVEMNINSEATLLPDQEAEYMVGNLDVTKGESIKFYKDDVQFTTAIGPDSGQNNGIKTAEFEFAVHNDAEKATMYFKVWKTGYSFWLTGFEKGESDTYTYTCNSLPSWITDNGCVIFVWTWGPEDGGSWKEAEFLTETSLTFEVKAELTGFLLARCAPGTTEPDWEIKNPNVHEPGRVYNKTQDISCTEGVFVYACSDWVEYPNA